MAYFLKTAGLVAVIFSFFIGYNSYAETTVSCPVQTRQGPCDAWSGTFIRTCTHYSTISTAVCPTIAGPAGPAGDDKIYYKTQDGTAWCPSTVINEAHGITCYTHINGVDQFRAFPRCDRYADIPLVADNTNDIPEDLRLKINALVDISKNTPLRVNNLIDCTFTPTPECDSINSSPSSWKKDTIRTILTCADTRSVVTP
jgi:hypothetical protein